MGIYRHPIHGSYGQLESTAKRHRDHLSRFVELTIVTDRQTVTDRPTDHATSVTLGSIYVLRCCLIYELSEHPGNKHFISS